MQLPIMKYNVDRPIVLLLMLLTVAQVAVGQDGKPGLANVPPSARAGWPGMQPNDQLLLPNGWSLTPQGEQIALGDLPVNIQLDPSGQFAAVLHCGYGDHEVRMISIKDRQVVSTAKIDQGFYGLAFLSGGKQLAVSGGEDERIYVFTHADGYLGKPKSFNWRRKKTSLLSLAWRGRATTCWLAACWGMKCASYRLIQVPRGTRYALMTFRIPIRPASTKRTISPTSACGARARLPS